MKTFRRDKLRRLIEAGRVVTVSTYSFDDMHGESRGNKVMPVAMKPDDWKDRKEGVCYMGKWDFDSKSGCCYQSNDKDPSRVTLIVHSNSNYEFRILDKAPEPEATP